MKSKIFATAITAFLILSLSTLQISAVTSTNSIASSTKNETENNNTTENHSIMYNLDRGFANILLCWLEVPRQIVHQGSIVPVFGLFSGALYGIAVTGWRALAGVTDILSLGFGGGDIFFAQGLPQFPWQGYWVEHNKKNSQ